MDNDEYIFSHNGLLYAFREEVIILSEQSIEDLRSMLKCYVNDENYEYAAKVRDEINRRDNGE